MIDRAPSPTEDSFMRIAAQRDLQRKAVDLSGCEPTQKPPVRTRKWISFVSAITNCLCAGSIILFSLWAPIFQQKLGYSQMQVNSISIAGELGMYLPVPLFGYICDKMGPSRLSVLSSLFFGPAYLLAAYAFIHKLPYQIMVLAFAAIGSGTSSMYFAGVTTCAKNFTGNPGIALSLPIAAFGLSSLWLSQLVSRMFVDKMTGELMIGNIFLSFSGFLALVGLLGSLGLTVINETEDTLNIAETEGLLEAGSTEPNYGCISEGSINDDDTVPITGFEDDKAWINSTTWEFLKDRTMWWFAGGVFFVTGPGEAFINNMGALITTFYPPQTAFGGANPIDPATHVSIIALTSTAARISAGLLGDWLAPATPNPNDDTPKPRTFSCSRMILLFFSSLLMCTGQLFVALGFVQGHGERFWVVSSFIGAGYGAVFCLAPTVVNVVWGTKNFGTNWGIITMTPALGASLFGLVFAQGYDSHAGKGGVCWGRECYERSFMIMAGSVGLALVGWAWCWKGRRGWGSKGVVV